MPIKELAIPVWKRPLVRVDIGDNQLKITRQLRIDRCFPVFLAYSFLEGEIRVNNWRLGRGRFFLLRMHR